jgi:hypothetical protein
MNGAARQETFVKLGVLGALVVKPNLHRNTT